MLPVQETEERHKPTVNSGSDLFSDCYKNKVQFGFNHLAAMVILISDPGYYPHIDGQVLDDLLLLGYWDPEHRCITFHGEEKYNTWLAEAFK